MTGMISRYVGYRTRDIPHFMMKPQNDVLMWLMEAAKGVERSLKFLALRLLIINFAGIHSTALVSDISSSLASLRTHGNP
jgi:hypothetical protein